MPGPGAALGEIIRRQRELSELSMRQLATMAGISNPYLSQIERGLREPSEKVLDAIAATLETSADKLYDQAGFAPAEETDERAAVETAIEQDAELSPRQRQAMLEIYRAFRATGPRPPRRRRTQPPGEGDAT